ncbi:hypothetical protein [Leifsonia shinshuensis]|uniref:hypothetical protein n=1 Tax=Leifsonia shinshuensis TaxID=150026 RepID=UPI002857C4A8|nr:hypothetical protein [Leifsonia shinshuensis]MDR6971605.1 cell division protein FtsX [Leifsonia shinshuensis]
MTVTQPGRDDRRNLVVALLAIGTTTTLLGVVFGLVMKTAAEQTNVSSTLVTLPVGVYKQYTQRAFVPDYTGLWIGLVVAAVGALVLIAALVVARRRTPAA